MWPTSLPQRYASSIWKHDAAAGNAMKSTQPFLVQAADQCLQSYLLPVLLWLSGLTAGAWKALKRIMHASSQCALNLCDTGRWCAIRMCQQYVHTQHGNCFTAKQRTSTCVKRNADRYQRHSMKTIAPPVCMRQQTAQCYDRDSSSAL